jgi:hypothetical protein
VAIINSQKLRNDITDVDTIVWQNLKSGDNGRAVSLARHSDKSIQVYGTFDGATVTVQETNDLRGQPGSTYEADAEWVTCKDPLNTEMVSTSSAKYQFLDIGLYTRVIVTGGTANTDITVSICAKRVL